MDNSMNLWLQISVDLRIVIIIIKSLINSAALKTQTRCRHMSFSAAEQVCLQVSCKINYTRGVGS